MGGLFTVLLLAFVVGVLVISEKFSEHCNLQVNLLIRTTIDVSKVPYK